MIQKKYFTYPFDRVVFAGRYTRWTKPWVIVRLELCRESTIAAFHQAIFVEDSGAVIAARKVSVLPAHTELGSRAMMERAGGGQERVGGGGWG